MRYTDMGGRGSNSGMWGSDFSPTSDQRDFEESIRGGNREVGAYFDKDGNVLLRSEGDLEEINFDAAEVNRNVEQRVWNNEEVNFTHNHPENTIFSPEDVSVFERMENHSMRAVLPNGTDYTLTRIQPRSSNEYVLDPKTGEFKQTFTPKKIAPAYDNEYSKVYDSKYRDIRRNFTGADRAQRLTALDSEVASHMGQWLKNNAKRYGYSFKEGGR